VTATDRNGATDRGHGPWLERLWESPDQPATDVRGGGLPPDLRERYDGELRVALRADRPTVIANFVSTIDGVVAFDTDGSSGGGEVSGFFEPDRFVMGLLRAMADVVLVGSGTVRAAPTHEWTPRRVHKRSAASFASWRRALGIPTVQPTTIVATASGDLDLAHPGLSAADVPVILATTPSGAERLRAAGPRPNATIATVGHGRRVPAPNLVALAASTGARLVLCEGGPHLIGELLAAKLLDEVFLTIAPQLAGRDEATPRLGLVQGTAFSVADAPWASLGTVRRSSDHLFLRYRFSAADGPADSPIQGFSP
jgi:riboflavin biosynthesis pyrimidine reductase